MAAHQLRHESNFTGKRGSNTVSTQQAGRGPGIKRRTIVQGVAWSVPVVVAAQALPAFATSPLDVTGSFGPICKYPGSSTAACTKAYRVVMTFTNSNQNPNDSTVVQVNSATLTGSNQNSTGVMPLQAVFDMAGNPVGMTFDLASGQSKTFAFVFGPSGSSADFGGQFCVTYTFNIRQTTFPDGGGSTTTQTSCTEYSGSNPCRSGVCGGPEG